MPGNRNTGNVSYHIHDFGSCFCSIFTYEAYIYWNLEFVFSQQFNLLNLTRVLQGQQPASKQTLHLLKIDSST
jgi:hypothetical protein